MGGKAKGKPEHGRAVIKIKAAAERERERQRFEEELRMLAALNGRDWDDLEPNERDIVLRFALKRVGVLNANGVVMIDIDI